MLRKLLSSQRKVWALLGVFIFSTLFVFSLTAQTASANDWPFMDRDCNNNPVMSPAYNPMVTYIWYHGPASDPRDHQHKEKAFELHVEPGGAGWYRLTAKTVFNGPADQLNESYYLDVNGQLPRADSTNENAYKVVIDQGTAIIKNMDAGIFWLNDGVNIVNMHHYGFLAEQDGYGAYWNGDFWDESSHKSQPESVRIKRLFVTPLCNDLEQEAVLNLEKQGPDYAEPGEEITYTLNWSVNGNQAKNLVLTDYLPEKVTFVSANTSGILGNGYIRWNLGDRGDGESGSIVLTVRVDDYTYDTDILTNKATLTADNAESVEASKSTEMDAHCDLVISKIDNQDPVAPGDELTYTIEYENKGNGICVGTGVMLAEYFDEQTDFVSSSPEMPHFYAPDYPYSPLPNGLGEPDVMWQWTELIPDGPHYMDVTVKVDNQAKDGDVLLNKACIWAENTAADGGPGKVCVTEDTTVKVPVEPYFVLDIDKTAPETVLAGDELVYNIDWSISGNATATDTVITDFLPEGVEVVSTDPTYDNVLTVMGNDYPVYTLVWNLGDVISGSSGVIKVVVKTNSALESGTKLTNEAQITSGEKKNSSTATSTVITEAPPAEREWTYTCDNDCKNVDIIGTGMGNIEGTDQNNPATLTIPNYQNVDHILAQVVVRKFWYPYDLKPEKVVFTTSAGESYTLLEPTAVSVDTNGGVDYGGYFYEVRLKPAETITAEVIGDNVNGKYSPRSFEAYIVYNDTHNKSYNTGKLLNKTLYGQRHNPDGETHTEKFAIPTSATAKNVNVAFVVSDFDSSDQTVVLRAEAGSVSKEETFVLPTNGDELVLHTITLENVAGNVDMVTAQVHSPGDKKGDSVVWAGVNVKIDCSDIVKPEMDLSITKTVDKDTAQVGDELVYTLNWQVAGNQTAEDVVITDTLPAEVTLVSTPTDGGVYDASTHTVTWSLGDVTPVNGGSLELTVVVDSIPQSNEVTNNVIIKSGDKHNESRAVTTITEVPNYELSVEKTGPTEANAGEIIDYTISWQVTGNMMAKNVVIEDMLPVDVNLLNASGGGNYSMIGNTIRWELGDITPDNSGVINLEVRIGGSYSQGDEVINNVKIKSDNPDKTKTDQVTTMIVMGGHYDLGITKTADKEVVRVGENLTYTLNWQVNGNKTASNVIISDTLPEEVSFLSASDNGQYSTTTHSVIWDLGDVQPDATGTLEIITNVNSLPTQGDQIVNQAKIRTDEEEDEAEATTTVVDFTLTIAKTTEQTVINPGDEIAYSINWGVSGTATATDVVITDSLPTGVTFVDATDGGVYNSVTHTVIWTLGNITPGTVGSFGVGVVASENLQDGDELVNNVEIRSGEKFVEASVKTAITVEEDYFTLSIDKSAPSSVVAGDNITYTINWSVSGTITANGVKVTDSLPTNVSFVSATGNYILNTGQLTWDLGDVNPGDSGSFEVVVSTDSGTSDGTQVTNTAVIFNDEQTQEDSATTTVTNNVCTVNCSGGGSWHNVYVSKTAPETIVAGDSITYIISWRVTGNEKAVDVVVTDTLPENVSFVSASGNYVYNEQTREIIWSLGDITPAKEGELTVVVNSLADQLNNGDIIENNVRIVSGVKSDDDKVATQVSKSSGGGGHFELSIDKTAPAQVTAGESLTYSINWEVKGNQTANDVIVTDVLPANASLVSATGNYDFNANTNEIVWSLGDVNPVTMGSFEIVMFTNYTQLSDGDTILNYVKMASGSSLVDDETKTTVSKLAPPIPPIPPTPPTPKEPEIVVVPSAPQKPIVVASAQTKVAEQEESCPEYVCETNTNECQSCGWFIWLLVALLNALVLFVYWFFVSKEEIRENENGEYFIVKGNWGWALPVLLALIIIFLLLVFVCTLVPWWALLIVLAAYYLSLVSHQLLIKNAELKYSPGLPILITISTLVVYLLCGSWTWWVWLAVVVFYILTLVFYYLMIVKMNEKSRNWWWAAVLFMTVLVLVLEIVMRSCQCGK